VAGYRSKDGVACHGLLHSSMGRVSPGCETKYTGGRRSQAD
jgi:hypothetical protein